MTAQQLAAMRNGAENQVRLQAATRDVLAPLTEKFIREVMTKPELAATPETAALLAVPGMIDVYNNMSALFEGQRVLNSYDHAVFRSLNDALNQQAESQAAQRGHGIYLP